MRTIDKASRLMQFTRHRLRAELTCFTLGQWLQGGFVSRGHEQHVPTLV
jgi:hypothetical protein